MITDKYEGYETQYPFLLEHVETQLVKQMWHAKEVRVELDRMELLYVLTDEQRNVVKRLLPLFLKYELYVGDFWTDVYAKTFHCPEAQEIAVTIAMIERVVHARFYDKINKEFGCDNDDFYLSYLDDPAYRERAKWIGKILAEDDNILKCLAFGMIEGVALFAAFVLLRSFQSKGKNLIKATVSGTKQSALDERLHSIVLTDTLRVYFKELGIKFDESTYYHRVKELAIQLYDHEMFIIDALIGDEFNGTTKEEYKKFIRVLVNDYFKRIGSEKLPFDDVSSDLMKWFEIANETYSDPDFFTKGTNKEYESGWTIGSFGGVWK